MYLLHRYRFQNAQVCMWTGLILFGFLVFLALPASATTTEHNAGEPAWPQGKDTHEPAFVRNTIPLNQTRFRSRVSSRSFIPACALAVSIPAIVFLVLRCWRPFQRNSAAGLIPRTLARSRDGDAADPCSTPNGRTNTGADGPQHAGAHRPTAGLEVRPPGGVRRVTARRRSLPPDIKLTRSLTTPRRGSDRYRLTLPSPISLPPGANPFSAFPSVVTGSDSFTGVRVKDSKIVKRIDVMPESASTRQTPLVRPGLFSASTFRQPGGTGVFPGGRREIATASGEMESHLRVRTGGFGVMDLGHPLGLQHNTGAQPGVPQRSVRPLAPTSSVSAYGGVTAGGSTNFWRLGYAVGRSDVLSEATSMGTPPYRPLPTSHNRYGLPTCPGVSCPSLRRMRSSSLVLERPSSDRRLVEDIQRRFEQLRLQRGTVRRPKTDVSSLHPGAGEAPPHPKGSQASGGFDGTSGGGGGSLVEGARMPLSTVNEEVSTADVDGAESSPGIPGIVSEQDMFRGFVDPEKNPLYRRQLELLTLTESERVGLLQEEQQVIEKAKCILEETISQFSRSVSAREDAKQELKELAVLASEAADYEDGALPPNLLDAQANYLRGLREVSSSTQRALNARMKLAKIQWSRGQVGKALIFRVKSRLTGPRLTSRLAAALAGAEQVFSRSPFFHTTKHNITQEEEREVFIMVREIERTLKEHICSIEQIKDASAFESKAELVAQAVEDLKDAEAVITQLHHVSLTFGSEIHEQILKPAIVRLKDAIESPRRHPSKRESP